MVGGINGVGGEFFQPTHTGGMELSKMKIWVSEATFFDKQGDAYLIAKINRYTPRD